MNEIDKQYAKRTARVLRVVRRRRGLTQMDVAKALEISQSAISKLENAQLVPSAPQWFAFCELTKIPFYSIKVGGKDHET